jgi:hypothetical protein
MPLERLEAIEAIRQLVARHALLLDERNFEALAELYLTPPKRFPSKGWGTSFHLIGNHIVEVQTDDSASGIVYCRAEYEVGSNWLVAPMVIEDRYSRVAERWLFAERSYRAFYVADILESPLDVNDRYRQPGAPFVDAADLPEAWAGWRAVFGGQHQTGQS